MWVAIVVSLQTGAGWWGSTD